MIDALRGAQRVTAICHENPDADTLGAAIALRIAVERLGKRAEVVAADPVPPWLAFLPRVDEVRRMPALEAVDDRDSGRLASARAGCCPRTHSAGDESASSCWCATAVVTCR